MARLDSLSQLQESSNSPVISVSSKKSSSDEFFNIYNSLKKEDPVSNDNLRSERISAREKNPVSSSRNVHVSEERSIQDRSEEPTDLATSQKVDASDKAQSAILEDAKENSTASRPEIAGEQSAKSERKRATCAKNQAKHEKEARRTSKSDDTGQILPELVNTLGLMGKASTGMAQTDNTKADNTQEQENSIEVWSSLLSGILKIVGDLTPSKIPAENTATDAQGEGASLALLELLGGSGTVDTQLDKLAGLLQQGNERLSQILEKENLPAGIPLQFAAEVRDAILKMLKDPKTSAKIQEKISQPGSQKDLLDLIDVLAPQNNASKDSETTASQSKTDSLAGMSVAETMGGGHDLSLRALFVEQPRKATDDSLELNPNGPQSGNQSNGNDFKLRQSFLSIDQAKNFTTSGSANGNTNPESLMSAQIAPNAESKIASNSGENRKNGENPPTSPGNKIFSQDLKNSQVDLEKNTELLNKTSQTIQVEHGASLKQAGGSSSLAEAAEKNLRSADPLPVSHFSRIDPTSSQNATSLGSVKGAESNGMLNRIDKADLFSQIIDKARLISGKNQTEMVISLKPEFLGKMSLRASMVDNELVATINAESKQVRTLLENELPALRNSLQEQGIQVSKIMIVQESNLSFADWSQGNSTAHQHSNTNPNSYSAYRESSSALDSDASLSEPLPTMMPYSSGTVNLVA